MGTAVILLGVPLFLAFRKGARARSSEDQA
jgi:hypothetical protein